MTVQLTSPPAADTPPLIVSDSALPEAEAVAVQAPSDEEMARHLDRQLAAAAEQLQRAQARADVARREALVAADREMTSRPISLAQAAELAARTGGGRPAPAAFQSEEEPTLLLTRPPSTMPADAVIAPAARAAAQSGGFATLPQGATPTPGPTGTPAADPQMRQVGRYRVKSRLGRGGMATVYRAHDPQIQRDVAIKFLHASLCEDQECRMRFLREARAAGGLSHPNIVVVHDVGEIEGRPYMAMELIDGAPLSDTLEKTRRLPIRDAVVLGLQLAQALAYAHARGVVHRDIKPGNLMLLADGQTLKVADFGIAHMDDGGSAEQRTLVGAVMGTPQYMSPEQTRGDKVDGRSDLFSAGIVLYQVLAGERPFRGESLVAVATKIAGEDPPPLLSKRPDVPASLRRVVDRCLAKAPEQRYQSGQELAEALTKVLVEIDASARERGQARTVPLRVKWALTMALVVSVVMGLTAAIITQRQYAAMLAQVSDYGASLARFIAAQNAAAVLGDDWDAVDVQVQEIMKSRNFERVSVVDATGVVRVSSQPALVGQPYRPPGQQTSGDVGGTTATHSFQSNGEGVLGFDVPVLFQGKTLGRVALGIPERPLTQVARLSISLLAVLAAVTVLAVAIAMAFVANRFAKPIRLVGESMAEIGRGRFDHRINETRNDELGQLFQAFDAMARALQAREATRPTTRPPTRPGGGAGP